MDPKKDREALEDSFQEVIIEQMLKVPHINFGSHQSGAGSARERAAGECLDEP